MRLCLRHVVTGTTLGMMLTNIPAFIPDDRLPGRPGDGRWGDCGRRSDGGLFRQSAQRRFLAASIERTMLRN
jgi:hypothetical protein